MPASRERPGLSRRLAALATLALALAVVVIVVAGVASQPLRLVAVLALLAIAANALWYAVTREGRRRVAAAGMLLATITAAAAIVLFTPGFPLLVRGALLVLAFILGRYAVGADTKTLIAGTTPGEAVEPSRSGALIMNLKSGGGKAERFHLADECARRGIRALVLEPGNDLLALAKGAIDAGADAIGMAGGDGSQALVASVAAEHDVPLIVVPAGTRNHLALDLGLDRDDVVGALDAFGEAVERPMDLAEVNGRVFVNNVSLGLYATIVRSPEYRDAKRDTTLKELPRLLGPGAEATDLRFEDGEGRSHDSAHVIQVSNDPYGESVFGLGTRPRLDDGVLGIVTLVLPNDQAERRFVRALASGHPERYEGFMAWSAPRFEVGSSEAIPAGIDGESVELDPPLEFATRPRALRVRVPTRSIGLSPAARGTSWRGALARLWQIAAGRIPEG